MQVKQSIQTENGEVEYTANLSNEEVSFLLEYAINSLMQQGALPFVHMENEHDVAVQSLETQ